MFEVFSSLFDYFRESEEVSHESILAHLITTGCDPWEIGCATNCLNALFFNDAFSSQKTVQQTAVRVFSKEEQSVLPLEVQDFLHTLSRTGEIQYDEPARVGWGPAKKVMSSLNVRGLRMIGGMYAASVWVTGPM